MTENSSTPRSGRCNASLPCPPYPRMKPTPELEDKLWELFDLLDLAQQLTARKECQEHVIKNIRRHPSKPSAIFTIGTNHGDYEVYVPARREEQMTHMFNSTRWLFLDTHQDRDDRIRNHFFSVEASKMNLRTICDRIFGTNLNVYDFGPEIGQKADLFFRYFQDQVLPDEGMSIVLKRIFIFAAVFMFPSLPEATVKKICQVLPGEELYNYLTCRIYARLLRNLGKTSQRHLLSKIIGMVLNDEDVTFQEIRFRSAFTILYKAVWNSENLIYTFSPEEVNGIVRRTIYHLKGALKLADATMIDPADADDTQLTQAKIIVNAMKDITGGFELILALLRRRKPGGRDPITSGGEFTGSSFAGAKKPAASDRAGETDQIQLLMPGSDVTHEILSFMDDLTSRLPGILSKHRIIKFKSGLRCQVPEDPNNPGKPANRSEHRLIQVLRHYLTGEGDTREYGIKGSWS